MTDSNQAMYQFVCFRFSLYCYRTSEVKGRPHNCVCFTLHCFRLDEVKFTVFTDQCVYFSMCCFRTSEVKGSPYLRICVYTSLCIVSGAVRLKVHRIYGSVCILLYVLFQAQ